MNKPAIHRAATTQAVGLFACLVAGLVATACAQHTSGALSESGDVRVLEVSPGHYFGPEGRPLAQACRNWALSPRQVEHFFLLSDTFEERPYNAFYQVECGISGQLQAEGRHWAFSINGGGTATWQSGDTIRHFGCAASGCAALLLLPSDGMEPD